MRGEPRSNGSAKRDEGASLAAVQDADARQSGSPRHKRYAWMDSGDEDGEDEDDSGESAEVSEKNESLLPSSVVEVRSFSEMLRMAPSLRRRASSMSSSELVAVCVAAGRVKFYDAPLLEEVARQLKQRLALPVPQRPSFEEMVSVVNGLSDLNAYDSDLFSAAARGLAASGALGRLDARQLRRLLASFQAVQHRGDAEFLEALVRRVKEARYEQAKESIMKDELERRWIR